MHTARSCRLTSIPRLLRMPAMTTRAGPAENHRIIQVPLTPLNNGSDSMGQSPVLVMTGGTSGIGRRALEMLLSSSRGWHVLLLARQSARSRDAADRLRDSPNLTLVDCDLADLRSVSSACTKIGRLLGGRPIDALALNAGVQAIKSNQVSRDGLEIAFAVNHLAHFLICERLRHRMSPGGRIIVTSSEVHDPNAFCIVGIARGRWQEPRELADPVRSQANRWARSNRGEARYSISKLLNLMYVRWLAQQDANLTIAAFNPSVVPGTEIARERVLLMQLGWRYIMQPLAGLLPGTRTVETSAGDLVWLVEDAPGATIHGQYVNGRVVEPGSVESRDEAKIGRMIDVSRALLRERCPDPGAAGALGNEVPYRTSSRP